MVSHEFFACSIASSNCIASIAVHITFMIFHEGMLEVIQFVILQMHGSCVLAAVCCRIVAGMVIFSPQCQDLLLAVVDNDLLLLALCGNDLGLKGAEATGLLNKPPSSKGKMLNHTQCLSFVEARDREGTHGQS